MRIPGLYTDGKMVTPICTRRVASLASEVCAGHLFMTRSRYFGEWSNLTFSEATPAELRQFTRETGIRVSLLPSPIRADKASLWRELLGNRRLRSGRIRVRCDLAWDAGRIFCRLKAYFANASLPPISWPIAPPDYTVANKPGRRAVPRSHRTWVLSTDLLRQYG